MLSALVVAVLLVAVGVRIAGAQTPVSTSVPASGSPSPGSSKPNGSSVSPTVVGEGPQADSGVIQPHQETLEARVLSASSPQPCTSDTQSENRVDPLTGKATLCQKLELMVTKGSLKGATIAFEEGTIPVASKANVVYKAGDNVLVDWEYSKDQPSTYHVVDYMRTTGLWVLVAVFVALAVAFGRLRGFTSLLGLAISFGVLLFFVVPRIVAGDDPVRISIAGALVIMVVTMYLSHGFNLKSTAAIFGTAISLVLTGLLAWLCLDIVKLTGFGSEDAVYVQIAQGGSINLRGLLLGGIIIGALGVLNDITIGQSSAVFEFHNHDPELNSNSLFMRVSNIGRDHIAATVNTLVLAYAGASLPLLILFVTGTDSWASVLNNEIVAQEIVRALVGSIGLIASVPITTWIASVMAVHTESQPVDEDAVVSGHMHGH